LRRSAQRGVLPFSGRRMSFSPPNRGGPLRTATRQKSQRAACSAFLISTSNAFTPAIKEGYDMVSNLLSAFLPFGARSLQTPLLPTRILGCRRAVPTDYVFVPSRVPSLLLVYDRSSRFPFCRHPSSSVLSQRRSHRYAYSSYLMRLWGPDAAQRSIGFKSSSPSSLRETPRN